MGHRKGGKSLSTVGRKRLPQRERDDNCMRRREVNIVKSLFIAFGEQTKVRKGLRTRKSYSALKGNRSLGGNVATRPDHFLGVLTRQEKTDLKEKNLSSPQWTG